jgi:uncharacterized protein YwqG
VNLYIFVLMLVAGIAVAVRIAGWIRERRAQSRVDAQRARHHAKHEAENPDQSPVRPEEIEEFKVWFASLALPAVELLPASERPVKAGGTRLGGPVWLKDDEAWPTDESGAPLEFVAQMDFAELPPLPDFPEAGLLQFFIGGDDVYGADYDDLTRGRVRVIWRPDGLEGGRLCPPPARTDDLAPWRRMEIRESGLPLAGRAAVHRPDPTDWRIGEHLKGQLRRPGIDEIDDLAYEHNPTPEVHHVGGHPVYTQYDFRGPGRFDDFDRTLLRLTSDPNLMWGDLGEAVFMIRRRDLLMRDFSNVIFHWDCT